MLNARITFGNIFAMDTDVPFVSRIQEENRISCVLDEAIFQVPAGYTQIGNGNGHGTFSVIFLFILLRFDIVFYYFINCFVSFCHCTLSCWFDRFGSLFSKKKQ